MVRQTKKVDAVVDKKLPGYLDSAIIFSKLIIHKLSNSSSSDLYTLCRMNFAADPVQTQALQFSYMGFSTINALDERSGISTPDTRIRRPTDDTYWSASNHVYGKTTAVGVSEAKSDYDYNYKLSFKFGKKIKN